MKKVKKVHWYKIVTGISLVILVSLSGGCGNKKLVSPPPNNVTNTSERETSVPSLSTSKPKISTSPKEKGISHKEAAQFIPLSPLQVTAEISANTIVLKWSGTGEDTIHYPIYRKNPNDKTWQRLGNLEATGDNLGGYEWVDKSTESGVTYHYGVSAMNFYDRESAIAESKVVTLP